MNYTTLTQQISDYCNRNDDLFKRQVPDFIEQAVNRIYTEAKNIGFEDTLEGQIDVNTNIIKKPPNWRITISLELYTGDQTFSRFLLPRTYEFCKTYWPNQTLLEVPEFYADYNNYEDYFVAPTPDRDYLYRLIYSGLPLFNEANGENFLTQRYSGLLFYACMVEAMFFIKDDVRIKDFQQLYQQNLAVVNGDSSERYTDRTLQRDKE
jgi:hypothetical protein